MNTIFVIGEDALSCEIGKRLVVDVMQWEISQCPIDCGGVTKLRKALPRYLNLARQYPILCVADTDRKCPKELLKAWFPESPPTNFILRLAVTESESWVLADSRAFATFLNISTTHIPASPDEITDPKRTVVNLARKSRHRQIRYEMVSSRDPEKPGSGYNQHLCTFVRDYWQPLIAAEHSPSLARAVHQLSAFSKGQQ
ncbi:hypothetical protein [Castellaniella defragrans]|jgi:hypothetical protein|uniref:hypothetical protein n=1 Tax=Castellaniella defragrans TaxID=75697 RepID=UPI0011DE0246|nr:hypothetical protein [Castellaniella defragrans]